MNHTQILENAIHKAIDGGWNPYWGQPDTPKIQDVKPDVLVTTDIGKGSQYDSDVLVYHRSRGSLLYHSSVYWLIFNHNFALALWGYSDYVYPTKEEKRSGVGGLHALSGYAYHLQQMVIADDPIKYLAENL